MKTIIKLFGFVVLLPSFTFAINGINSTVKIGENTPNGGIGLEAGDFYGRSVASIGDLDQDGIGDIAVGASVDENGVTTFTGAVHIHFLNADRTIKSSVKIGEATPNGPTGLENLDVYGTGVASIGDLNGDGVQDLLVGASSDENGATADVGAVYIHFMNTDGTIDSTVKIGEGTPNGPTGLDANDRYGVAVAGIGDLNIDGVEDIAVAAYFDETGAATNAGAFFIHFMNTDGTIDSTVKIGEGTTNGPLGLDISDGYGHGLSSIGDLNNDGVIDIAVGAVFDEAGATPTTGAVYIHYMNTDGTIDSTVKIGEGTANGPLGLDTSDDYGTSVASIGDLNGDGVQELLVGAKTDETGAAAGGGAVYLHYLNTDGTIDSTVKIGEGTANGPSDINPDDFYGSYVASLGDFNGDGLQDFIVGAREDETGPTDGVGAVYIHLTGTSISGSIFADLDGDGVDDGVGEPGIPNVTVRAWHDVDNDGVIDTATDQVVAGATTDINGNYVLYVPANNDYLVDVYDANNALNGSYNRLTSANEP